MEKGGDRRLRRLFKDVKLRTPDGTLKRCHAHMCRDTFAAYHSRVYPLTRSELILGFSPYMVFPLPQKMFVKHALDKHRTGELVLSSQSSINTA